MEKEGVGIRVGISIGDINGIGPEIIMKVFSDTRMLAELTPVIYGSTKVFAHYKRVLNEQEFAYQTCKSAEEAQNKKVNIVNVWSDEVEIQMGQATEIGGSCAFQALERATTDLASGKIDVLVTAPISKEAMAKSGFKFPGHTEYLTELSGEQDALMVMVSGTLRVALATTHIALKEVSSALSKDRILSKIKAFESSLKKDFGLVRPKIAVFGLNPHAGENGKMGSEEQEIIIPAINAARNEDILAFGPFPADGFFGSTARHQYDGILAMFHDQGLTAFKALAFDDGVNFTAGLPIVRTSPDHGTAFDIVGKNSASENSLRQAIYLSLDVYRTRKFVRDIHLNPLQSSPKEKKRTSEQVE
ncbi:MAG: 4-hydroxythreonine-4-phosphate dehydrogenase PdxA [Cryomorphaceae bacterium]|jgi:4-hydroxythreonine-4-phosphate dehydrogenase|nr:4-hydroxythreonine-4-phosphate dehydrogenase PdxA [Cryomorphaceae bacterium]